MRAYALLWRSSNVFFRKAQCEQHVLQRPAHVSVDEAVVFDKVAGERRLSTASRANKTKDSSLFHADIGTQS